MSNHTILTIGAFLILTTILVSFYRLLGSSGDDISTSQDLILATTIATSYLEQAQGLAFDAYTDTSNVRLTGTSTLTPAGLLGPEAGEDSIGAFNDFDDFNRLVATKAATGTNKVFTTTFRVNYVNPDNVDQISTTQTFMKRLDLKTWLSYPLKTDGATVDTLRMSVAMGYFRFD
jgi:hypothetical protein